jgi:hypothetical protein
LQWGKNKLAIYKENKICEINQPLGLGDILLCEPIANYYYKKGFDINFIVKDDFMWIREYINYINFINKPNSNTEPIFEKNYIYLPLIYKKISDDENFKKGGWLYDKYTTSRLDPDLWKTFNFNRNLKKENDLFDFLNKEGERFGINLNNKKYILVNKNHSFGTRSLNISSDHQVILMNYIEGYTMLDWCKVMEKAEEIHTVSTSILYPLIKLNHKNVTVYDRNYKGDGTKETIVEVFKEYNFKYE